MNQVVTPVAVQQAITAAAEQGTSLLRLITCGSVDDGKSTLIGRLLFEVGQIPDDQLALLRQESQRRGSDIDYSLLVDGLAAEREQGITIDVAYRYFATPRRKFIVADTPGHEQYTRNMATAASTAELAVLLVDGRKGVLPQTRRHSLIVALLGVHHVVLAVNKMDAIGFDETVFASIESQFRRFADGLGFATITCLPLSAKSGDNIIAASPNMAWYHGPTLLKCLETIDVARFEQELPFRMPVQWVNRMDADSRGYCGMIASGRIRPGDKILVQPSGRPATVARVLTADGDLDEAVVGQAVTVTFAEAIDVSRGDLLAASARPATTGNRWLARVLWVSQQPLTSGRSFLLKAGAAVVPVVVDHIVATVDIASGTTTSDPPLHSLALNEIGVVKLTLDRRLGLDPYRDNRATGGFILIDRESNDTVAMGLIEAVDSSAPAQLVNDSYASMEGLSPEPAHNPPSSPPSVTRVPMVLIGDAAVMFACAFAVLQAPIPAAATAGLTLLVQFCLRRAVALWRGSNIS
jgi:sulfate adenylyltransferase large subunit